MEFFKFLISLGARGIIILFLILGAIVAWGFISDSNKRADTYNSLILPAIKSKSHDLKPFVIDNQMEPELPDEGQNNKTLLGVDSNKNGVRDDIEIWINRTAQSRNLRLALKQYAMALGKTYRIGSMKDIGKAMDESVAVRQEIERASSCISFVDYDINDEKLHYFTGAIDSLVFNTYDRQELNSKYFSRSLNINYKDIGDFSEGKTMCNFYIDDYDKIKDYIQKTRP